MTTTRTPINRGRKLRITPEILEAYKRARKLYDTSKIDEWGLLSDQCRAACGYLHVLLGRTACDLDIFDTIGCEAEGRSWNEKPEQFADALAVRRELERLA
ncbi:hypothetical protein GWG65_03475 [Bradyrhizobium sp. CSA207]|uniref:hypothetical protein n=1 Tax=Bradyrhizobium sp. CSA207 TaxID=2698826 RepID=UPI0023AEA0E1|nr:hypothetical protein [Bradyrhizobium sp. CSA207]MDE5440524.1 hypothetical protein [Bradyrhizobium sp. CSA207]